MTKSTPYKIVTANSLLDNVHGFISLTKVEDEIERLPIFKRLKDISQLGLTDRIFPCALHNRYVHSLGVMYIVDQMATHLGFDDDERQIVRLAALLHDIGHYPFSHDVEAVYMEERHVADEPPADELTRFAVAASKNVCALEQAGADVKLFMQGTQDIPCHHESIGVIVIRSSTKIQKVIQNCYIRQNKKFSNLVVSDVLASIIDDICAIITGDIKHVSTYFKERFGAMVQIMHSELDADRVDYLLRDASFSGAAYGALDLGMLMQNLRMAKDPDTQKLIVGVSPKGICFAEQFLLSRYFAYNQVIFHKHASVLGCALQSVVRWLLSERATGFCYNDIETMAKNHESDPRFLAYNDSQLTSIINGLQKEQGTCPDAIFNFVRCIKEYRAPNMQEEFVFSGIDAKILHKQFAETSLYGELLSAKSGLQKIYQYRQMEVTKHQPLLLFKEKLKKNIDSKKIDEEMVNEDDYYSERLQDGLAVIEENNKPYLLVDSPRTMLHDIHTLRYCILRSYTFAER